MPRIPEEEISRLKAEIDLAALVRSSGVELKGHGADLVGRCPFHDDKGPSLVVTPEKNLWHCMGACQKGGSVIDWVMTAQGVSFRHAVEILRDKNPSLASAPPLGVRKSSVRKLPPPVALDVDDQKLLNRVVDFYHEALKSSSDALRYLDARGLHASEAVDRFKLGYANRTLGYRLPDRNRKLGSELRGRLERIGVYRESGHEHFAGSLVIPIMDEHANVTGLYGRKIRDDLRPGTVYHLYLPGPHKGVWNVEALSASKEIILCEALLDALTFWCAGFRNVTASYGVSGFTPDILEALKKHAVEKVLIAYDRDDAGDAAAEQLAPKLADAGMDVSRILFPRGMDANEYALKVTPPSESLGLLVRSAIFVAKGKRAAEEKKPEDILPSAAEAPQAPQEAPPSGLAASAPTLAVRPDHVEMVLGDRTYRARGLEKNMSHDQLRVTLRASREDRYHVDTLDLYSARQRQLFVKLAADELALKPETVKKDLGKVLLELEALQAKRIREALEPKTNEVVLTDDEKKEAMELLRDPRLLDRIAEDFEKIGVIGEETNKLVGYLAVVSRKIETPLAVLVQSSSAAGKSVLMDAILSLVPDEDVERYTAMTGQALFYMMDTKLAHKVLAIAEIQGAERAGYAIKMLQSEGKISIATTVKDPQTGQMVTQRREVDGPVALVLTTTDVSIDEELQNRAIVLTVDEERRQTRAIHDVQRRAHTLSGMLDRQDRAAVVKLHQNAQRLLKPLLVVNPYADRLTFLDTKLRTRRDHVKYLTLIRSIALLFQYQRPVRHVDHHGRIVPYIEATIEDVETANRLAAEVLGRSLDELAPQTRRLLMLLDKMVGERCAKLSLDRDDFRFSRREAREHTHWGDFQLRTHLDRLVELEYAIVHRGGRGQSFVYELVYDGAGKDGRPFLPGLLDVERLRCDYDGKFEPRKAEVDGPSSPQRAGVEPGSSDDETPREAPGEAAGCEIDETAAEKDIYGTAREKQVVRK